MSDLTHCALIVEDDPATAPRALQTNGTKPGQRARRLAFSRAKEVNELTKPGQADNPLGVRVAHPKRKPRPVAPPFPRG